jgi:hypothetical protein
VIQAFPPNRADQSLDISPLPRRSWSCQHLFNVHVPDLAFELVAEDLVAVSQQIPRDLLKRKTPPATAARSTPRSGGPLRERAPPDAAHAPTLKSEGF